ncbi:MAG: prepilin peptidase [Dehalococcoidia bacterium]
MDALTRARGLAPAGALLLAAGLGALAAAVSARDAMGAAVVASASTLIVAAVRWDVRARRIPNAWTYPGLLIAVALGLLDGWSGVLAALGGGAVAGGLFSLLAAASRGGLGIGDVKLGAALGAFVGPGGAVDLVLVSAVAGGALGLAWLLTGRGRHGALPYAPALAAGGWFALAALGPLGS